MPKDCDCTIVPFKPNPPCFERCAAKILSQANFEQLTTIFGLPAPLSNKIVSLPNRTNISSLADYAMVLHWQDIFGIRKVFENLTQAQLDSFQKPQQSEEDQSSQAPSPA